MLKGKKKTYGNTWWGKVWIEALEKIDSNRLDRGKTYANQGKIKSLEIANESISACVKGAYQSLYNLKISLEKFTTREIEKIKEIISQNPSVAIELGMGILSEDLLELIERDEITLLPKNWDDLKSKCSCPDPDNPCKHLAAVYYMVANEIDKDPFIIFNLKGIETTELIKLSGIEIQNKTTKFNHISEKFIEYTELRPKHININVDNFEFSYPKFDIKSLLALLSDNPPFYNEGNFKEFIEKIYKIVPQQISSVIPQIEGEPALIKNDFFIEYTKEMYSPLAVFKIKIVPDKNNFYEDRQKIVDIIEKNHLSNYKNSSSYDWKKQTPVLQSGKVSALVYEFEDNKFKVTGLKTISTLESQSILEYFLNMPININFEKASDSFAFLNILSSVALGMVKANLFLPEVLLESDETFTIRYIPIVKEDRIQNIIDELKKIMPVDICSSDNKFLIEDGILDILSIFITNIVKRVLRKQNTISNNKIISAFCNDYLFRVGDFTENTVAKSICNWFDKLYISKKEISPLIRFESFSDDNFSVFVDITGKNNPHNSVIQYKELYKDSSQKFFNIPFDKVRIDVSSQIIFASEYFKELKEIINSKGEIAPVIPIEKISEIFLNTVDIFKILGIEVVFPKELKKLAFPQLRARAKLKKVDESGESYLNLHELLDFSYEIAIGNEIITANEFIQLVNKTQGLVKYKNSYILIKPEDIQSILNKLKEPVIEMSSSIQALYTAVSGDINGVNFEADESLMKVIEDFTKIEDVPLPENLNGTLRPYQERGFKWLYSNAQKGFGSCLADDMGLGKTIQVITLLLDHKNKTEKPTPSLVICPTTLIGNWEKECKKFAPSLNLNIYHGTERQLEFENTDVLITSYSIFRRDLKLFSNENWKFLIVDESQNIKNSETLQTKAIKSLKADNYIAMTGTPVENRLSELWNIFDFINKGYMGSLTQFKSRLATPIEKYKDKESIEKLKKATAPFILRRLKTDKSIISDLPDKISFDEYCYLTKEQAAIYQNIVEETMKQIEDSGGIQRKGLIFKLITSLKQICNHPAHYTSSGIIDSVLSGKTSKALSIIETILSNKEKALIFTQYRKMGDILQSIIKKELNEESLFFHGGITRKKRDEMVNLFQNERKSRIMIISLKAGGTGLNLTEASNVIHYDLWWNPAVEEQATDRAYRIGQDKNVIVHRLITLGTFEEKIDEIIKSKKELADLTVSTGESWITEMSNRDLREIFSLYK